MNDLEQRELGGITRLGNALLTWQKDLGPGLDASFSAVMMLIREIDAAAAKAEAAGQSPEAVRTALVEALEARLAAGPEILPRVKTEKAARVVKLGADKAASQMSYDLKTLELMVAEFPAWYAEVGIGGFFNSLRLILRIFDENFQAAVADGAEFGAVLFVPAFEIRRSMGKVPPELLEALEIYDNETPA